jgi:hypothetical protein
VLDVDRREDVDTRGEQVLDVLVALLVLEAGGVGVGELVDERELRRAAQERREVHVPELGAAVVDAPPRHRRQSLGKCRRVLAPVRLDQPDDHVTARLELGVALLQHAVGLAHPGRHAEEDRVAPSPNASGLRGVL